ncbi:MAG: GGDEF domain-containing protein [Oscillospiraceae bacterium]|nr:GGDEF domain-containing protein [Oscillospiraceae bacterium]
MKQMINGRKTIGFIVCGVTGDFKKDVSRYLTEYAAALGYDIFVFSFVGKIGASYTDYGEHEDNLVNIIPYEDLDVIVYDNSNMFTDDIKGMIEEMAKSAGTPVITISEPNDDFYEVHFDNRIGIREMVKHFVEHHGFTKIGYMSGIPGHPDSVERLDEFRKTMKDYGLPEDGVGVFHGDFWYNSSEEAADFFWNKCSERPQAVICANDYMAYSLCDYMHALGVSVPGDVCISGVDGVPEAIQHYPSITTVEKDNRALSRKLMDMIDNIVDGREQKRVEFVSTKNEYRGSCCPEKFGDEDLLRRKNESFVKNVNFLYYIYDTEASMLEMNRCSEPDQISHTFLRYGVNIGNYDKFFVFTYVTDSGKNSYETAVTAPTKYVRPAVWIDKTNTMTRPDKPFAVKNIIPAQTDQKPHCWYISHIHFGDHIFGYSVINMVNDQVYNDFYNIWTVNLAVSFESLLRKNSIRSLVDVLEHESTHDRLTGLLNRRGFEQSSSELFDKALSDPEKSVGCIMIDMDKLKRINDDFGHAEGDYAIQALGQMIGFCCTNDEIAGRTGGDEFYVFAVDYDQQKADTFVKNLRRALDLFNESENKEYKLDASWGIYIRKVSEIGKLENLLKLSDELMYGEKRKKYKYQ